MAMAPGAEEIEVYFARSINVAQDKDFLVPTVVVVPTWGTFNDFGKHFVTTLYVVQEEVVLLELPLRVMFAGLARSEIYLTGLFESIGDLVPTDEVQNDYLSLIPDVFGYRAFVDVLGYGQALSALRDLRDAALLRLEEPTDYQVEMLNSETFHEGILRHDEAYTALRRGARYLRPRPFPDATARIGDFTISAKLPSADNVYEVDFDFTSGQLFKDRAAVLVGRNGVGKTQILSQIVFGLTEAGRDAGDVVALDPVPPVGRVLVFSSVTSDAYPKAIFPWEGVDYEFFGVTASHNDPGNGLLSALAACRRPDDFHVEGIGGRKALLARVLQPMGLWAGLALPLKPRIPGQDQLVGFQTQTDAGRFILFRRQMNEQRNLAAIRELDWSREVVVLNQEQEVRRLSSGEVAMLRFAAQACSAIELNSMVLFDEPETHMHPNFISDFMTLLQELLSLTSSVAIIATHSSYVVREVSRERVRVCHHDRQPGAGMWSLQHGREGQHRSRSH